MICDRCKKETAGTRMSYFNTEVVCLDCIEEESNHPLYSCAKDVEHYFLKQGIRNYPGIGLPPDLFEKYNK